MSRAKVFATISPVLMEKVQVKMLETGFKLSEVVSRALEVYVTPKSRPVASEPVFSTEAEVVTGLQLAIERKPDAEITPSFHLGSEVDEKSIRALKTAGVNITAVIAARRAKRAGREYDHSLEQYFNQV